MAELSRVINVPLNIYINPLHPNISIHILHTLLYTQENIIVDQGFLATVGSRFVIISFIPVTKIFDSELIL